MSDCLPGRQVVGTLGRTFNSTTTCLTRFWMHLGIRIRHIPKKVGKNIVFQCHETIEAAEILCYKFIKGQIELSLFLGKQPFSLTKCECRGLNDKNWLGKISFRPLHSHLVSEMAVFPKKWQLDLSFYKFVTQNLSSFNRLVTLENDVFSEVFWYVSNSYTQRHSKTSEAGGGGIKSTP